MRGDPSPEGATGPAGAVSGDQAQVACARYGLGAVGGAALAQDVGHVRFDHVERTTRSRAMRWLDLPAASSRSTASSRQVSGSAGPGGGTVPAWPQARTSAAHCPAERFSSSTSTASDSEQAVSAWPPVMIGSGGHSPTWRSRSARGAQLVDRQPGGHGARERA
jgi:hypothetical protein